MKNRSMAALAAVLASAGSASADVVIRNVTVIDCGEGAALPARAVVVHGERIASVVPDAEARPAADDRVIDGAGKFLIPGLWDMHTHTLRPERKDFFPPLFVAAGVTGVRDMGAGDLALRDRWRDEAAKGDFVAPRIVGTGAILDGPLPMIPNSVACKDVAAAEQAVRDAKAAGADFVKVYSLLPPDILDGIARTCRAEKMSFVGHVPERVPAERAAELGMASMEHGLGVLIGCSSQEAPIRERLSKAIEEAGKNRDRRAFAAARRQAYADAAETYDPERARRLFAIFAGHGTYQCPTLTYWKGAAVSQSGAGRDDPRWKDLPASMTSGWWPASATPNAAAPFEALFRIHQRAVTDMHAAGVPILAGTDTLAQVCFPGWGLHDELALLVEAGLSPKAALQAATLNPARLLGRTSDLGSIEPGKLADLVLLDANPLSDIRNTAKIHAVIVNGRLLDRAALDALVADVRRRAAASK